MSLSVTAFTGLGDGIHDIVVTELGKKPAKAGGEYLRWEFMDRDGKTASANSSVEMTPGNKTGKWFAALTGRPTVIGEDRQMSEVVGKPGTIVIEINPEGYPKVIALTARSAAQAARQPVIETVKASETPRPIEEAEALGTDPLPF